MCLQIQRWIASDNGIKSDSIIIFQEKVFSFLILIFLIFNSTLLFFSPVNQDEFFNLSLVYKFVNGDQLSLFQTFHVHLFSWITIVGKNEIDQIFVLRMIMLLFFLCSCICLYLIGEKIMGKAAALFSVFCFITFAFVSLHGCSFRTDTIALFCFLISTYIILWKTSLFHYTIAGVLMALSMILTIKSSIHFITLSFILINQYWKIKDNTKIRLIIVFFLVFSTVLFSFFLFHKHSLSPNIFKPGGISQTVQLSEIKDKNISHASSYVFLKNTFKRVTTMKNLFPEFRFFPILLYLNYITWFFFAYGFFIVLFKKIDFEGNNKTRRCLLGFCIPLITLLFYKNAYPYYYVFIMAPCVLFCGIAVKQINEISNTNIKLLLNVSLCLLILFIVFQGSVISFIRLQQKTYYTQKEFFINLHKIFPKPVKYIDGSSMASSFHNVGPFMGTSWVDIYREKGSPIFKQIIVEHQPKFIIGDIPQLDLENKLKSYNYPPFLEEDQSVLKKNYISHWGLIYIAGKKFHFSVKREIKKFEIIIPGKYLIEGNGKVVIDGNNYAAGDAINLKLGNHFIKSLTASGYVFLRLDSNRPQSQAISNLKPLFMGQLL